MVSIIPPRIDQFSSDHWSQTRTGRVSTYMGDRLGIPCVLSIFSLFSNLKSRTKWLLVRILKIGEHFRIQRAKLYQIGELKNFEKNSSLWQSDLVGVLVLQGAKNRNFTHPIFESDFDCLTGKHRILALSLLPLLPLIIQNKIIKIKYKHSSCCILHLYSQ